MNDKIRCIAIDDEPLALNVISKFCERLGGISLEVYSDPEAGLEAIRNGNFDLAFLDIEMEGINGLKIAAELPAHTSFPDFVTF